MLSKKLLILFLIVIFTVLQSTLLNQIRIFEIKPDILLILIIFFSLYSGQMYAVTVGALCGLFSEATSGLPTAAAVFTYSLAGLILAHISRWVYRGGIFGQMCISFIFCSVIYLILFLLFQILNADLSLANTLGFIILPASFYTACISPLVFLFLKTIYPLSSEV